MPEFCEIGQSEARDSSLDETQVSALSLISSEVQEVPDISEYKDKRVA